MQRGRRIVARACAGCHATSFAGPSAYRAAPPLWRLRPDRSPESLQRAAAGAAGHQYAMPSVILSLQEAGDVVAYIRALSAADPETQRRLAVSPCIATRC